MLKNKYKKKNDGNGSLLKILKIVFLIIAMVGVFILSENYYEQKEAKITIYRVKDTLNDGFPLVEANIIEETQYKTNLYNDYISDIRPYVGKSVSMDIPSDGVLRKIHFEESQAFNNLYKVGMKENYTFIAVKTSVEDFIGGIPNANDYVNVITREIEGSGVISAVTLFQNIRVVATVNGDAIDVERNNNNDFLSADSKPYSVILEIPKDKEALIAAHDNYVLSLNPDNYEPYESEKVFNTFYYDNNKDVLDVEILESVENIEDGSDTQ